MDYLDSALALLRSRAYFSQNVNWASITAQAAELAAAAQSPADCYAAIQLAVAALNDNHSFFIGAQDKQTQGPTGTPLGFGALIIVPELVTIEVFPDSAAERAGLHVGDVIELVNDQPPPADGARLLRLDPAQPATLQVRRGSEQLTLTMQAAPITKAPLPRGAYLGAGIGYLELFVQGDPEAAQQYIDTAQQCIRSAAAAGARAWIVDLRRDRGGNMWPMLTGAGPLLGDGLLGTFIDADGSTTRWLYERGTTLYQQAHMDTPQAFMQASDPVPTFDPHTTPVAVLTSELTGSSGEMTLIAFRGRPRTRTFGARSSGEITGVAIHELSDGALLGIAESIAADRSGQSYASAIEPDEPVSVDWLRCDSPADPVLNAAKAWLQAELRA